MTQVNPISSLPTPAANGAAASGATSTAGRNDQFGQETFLKLLVAQLKYQNPLSPTDSSQFLAQTAQFTTLETLQKMAKSQEAATRSNQVLAASSMVGRSVSYSLATSGSPAAPAATSTVSMRGSLPKDAAEGTTVTRTADVFTRTGQKIPLAVTFTRTADAWTVDVTSGGRKVGNTTTLQFDATGDRTGGDPTVSASALDTIAGTSGGWPASGITLALGGKTDADRLQLADGPATVSVTEQNGHDGNSARGIVSGIRLTNDEPMLVIGGREIPLSSISDVQS